ncbi:MAG: hypothetical protein ABSH03_09755 [Candidatus Lustribacter sp.]|jgi:hypothetical protein
MPTLNPHIGQQGLPYTLTFPTHAGQDDVIAFRGSVLYGDIAARDDSWRLRAGWFDLVQSDRFVFAPVAITSVIPALGPQTQESLVPSYPALASWTMASAGLPLHGADLVLNQGLGTVELTDADLPSPPGIGTRLTMASLVIDHGGGTRWSAQFAHLNSGGEPLSSSVLYGTDPLVPQTEQGVLAESTVAGQRQTIVGLRGAFHLAPGIDGLVEIGRSWFDADGAANPYVGPVQADYEHFSISHTVRRLTGAIEWYRFDPYYAPFSMAYGANENFWTSAWSWPGFAYESGYQSVDNSIVSNNRQGLRARFNIDGGPIEMHLVASHFDQITPYDLADYANVGFTETEFPPQIGTGTIGRQGQLGAWLTWHLSVADVILDSIYDQIDRAPSPGQPEEAVHMSVPQYVLTVARTFNSNFIATVGFGRFAQIGAWAVVGQNNIDFSQRTAFLGAQWRENDHLASILTVRRTTFSGQPFVAGGPIQDYEGWTVLFEQRFHY